MTGLIFFFYFFYFCYNQNKKQQKPNSWFLMFVPLQASAIFGIFVSFREDKKESTRSHAFLMVSTQLTTQYAHDVVLKSVPRRFNVMDVVWTSKRRCVLTGYCTKDHDISQILNQKMFFLPSRIMHSYFINISSLYSYIQMCIL